MVLPPKTIPDYLVRKGLFEKDAAIAVAPLGGGLINHLFVARGKDRSVVLKMADTEMKFNRNLTLPRERVITEYEALRVWRNAGLNCVPTPFFVDRENFIVGMEEVGKDAEMLTSALLEGRIDFELVKKLGKTYARLHSVTFGNERLKKAFPVSDAFRAVKLNLYYREMLKGSKNRDIKEKMREILKKQERNRICFIQGDVLPKNILVKGPDFVILDHELSVYGDPAQDLGVFLSAFILAALINWPLRKEYYRGVLAFWESYSSNARFRKLLPKIKKNAIANLTGNVYGRAVGKVEIDIATPATKKAMVKVANRIALDSPYSFEDVFRMIDDCKGLSKNRPWKKEELYGRLF